ncbi:MAG TPA: PfaD family polyunsaturated fatty acid/polyketide biosynthesis protein [Planctomycetota bacterium]|nr:PfaD family polyunsaturated fatty acid/polyketide biosynthesis protein [Planctomycetota bacterium]
MDARELVRRLRRLGEPLHIRREDGALALAPPGAALEPGDAFAPACRPEDLGDPTFRADHGLRYAYTAGAMASGIGSAEIAEALGQAGMLAFFGSAGLPLAQVEAAIERLGRTLAGRPVGYNLIHSPNEPDLEAGLVDLYLRRGVRLVSASAYLGLTPAVVKYRVRGLRETPSGEVFAPNRIVATVSRVEVASRFLAPPPAGIVADLLARGEVTADEARLAARIPLAQDLTAEADSAGHTDNRPAIALVPTLLALRDRLQAEHGYRAPLRVGAAGGIGTPHAAAAAFAMGAAFISTGSVNQACVESGTSALVREMLAQAQQADVAMAPAGDMFEMGVKVQVLKRGTLFPVRAQKLHDLYRACRSLEEIPAADRAALERDLFRAPLEEIWRQTRAFFETRDPRQNERAERDPKHKMALVFRWYLGQSSRWAKAGDPARKVDFQVWCGPAMGAFNEWAAGSPLERPEGRRVVDVALNILHGAAALARLNVLRCQGIHLPNDALRLPPRTRAELERDSE